MAFNQMTAQEAAEIIHNGATIGLSGFTAPGTPKAITEALAAKAVREHEAAGLQGKHVYRGVDQRPC